MASIVKKLLIANRGEIALRVVRTAKEMGISTVAVYSEQDRNSRYVDMADEAYLLSGDTYKDTYLNEDLLIDILHKTGANAVHPGYGFLSEVPSFAQKVEDAGAIWVGPHHTALVDLGDKITARRVALRAKVPPVPGLSEPVTDVRTLLDFAHTHGYPIMMKRTDGGGGHGITVVHDDEELRRFYMNHDALQGGDLKEYFIEKFVDKARHVETQSGRDSHGNFTVYSTRDCSLQRRNQKLVEEAPAPFLSEEIISTLEEYSRRRVHHGRLRGPGHLRIHGDPERQGVLPGSQPALAGGAHRLRRGQRPRPGARTAQYRRRWRAHPRPRTARPQLRTAHHQPKTPATQPDPPAPAPWRRSSGRPAPACASIPVWNRATPSPRSSIR